MKYRSPGAPEKEEKEKEKGEELSIVVEESAGAVAAAQGRDREAGMPSGGATFRSHTQCSFLTELVEVPGKGS